jgi:hypothetical protein
MDNGRAEWLKDVGLWWANLTKKDRADIRIEFAEVELAEAKSKEKTE